MDTPLAKIGFLAIIFTLLGISASPHPLLLILCYLIHELGHIILAKAVGAKMKHFKIASFHLSLSYDTSTLSYKRELLVYLGGIIFNLLTALICIIIPFFKGEVCEFLVICNLSLALMNLYPVSVLDGGGILNTGLKLVLSEGASEKISRGVSIIAIIVLWLLAVYLQLVFASNFSLFFISIALLVELSYSYLK